MIKKIDLSKTQSMPDNFHEMVDRVVEAERKLSISY